MKIKKYLAEIEVFTKESTKKETLHCAIKQLLRKNITEKGKNSFANFFTGKVTIKEK